MCFHAIHLDGLRLAGWYIQMFFELLFRLLTLRLDYVKSVLAFFRTHEKVNAARYHLSMLSRATGTDLSLNEVTKLIRKSISTQNINIF